MPQYTEKSIPWNKGKIVGRKPPLSPEQVRVIRTLLSQHGNIRNIALFAVAIYSSLRGVDILALNVSDVLHGEAVKERVTVYQSKTGQRVTFALTDYTRVALRDWIREGDRIYCDPLFSAQKGQSTGKRLSAIRYRQLVKQWIGMAQLDPSLYGTHSLRRTHIAYIYKKTGNIKAAQVLLGHKSIENTAKYLGIEEEEALNVAEQFEI